MIYKSFFRKKTTKIYIIIFTTAILFILLLNSFITHYQDLENTFFSEKAIFVIESDNDSYKLLKKYGELTNIERVLTLKPNKDYVDVIGVRGGTISSLEGTIVIPSSDKYQEKITWDMLETPSVNGKVIFVRDDTLEERQIAIGIPKTNRGFVTQEMIDNTLSKKIGFYNNDKNYEFMIDNIYFANFSEFRIASDLFDEFLKEETKYTYRAKINSYKNSSKIKVDLQKTNKLKNQSVIVDSRYEGNEYDNLIRIGDLLMILKVATYTLMGLFIIFVFIINKNQISDLKQNIDLEYKIGYSKRQIKFNLLKRLLLIYIISYFLALILLRFILVIIYKTTEISLKIPEIKLLIIIALLCNMLISVYLCKRKNLRR